MSSSAPTDTPPPSGRGWPPGTPTISSPPRLRRDARVASHSGAATGQGTGQCVNGRDRTAWGATISYMRPDIRPGGIFPDYALPDHTGTVRSLSASFRAAIR